MYSFPYTRTLFVSYSDIFEPTRNAEYTVFLNCSEVLVPSSCRWDRPKLESTCNSFIVLVTAVTVTVDAALRLVVGDAFSQRVVTEA